MATFKSDIEIAQECKMLPICDVAVSYTHLCDNGLRLFVVPKRGFAKNYAFFATNYGSMDMRFCLNGEWKETPAGVAHYLEHKMFDTKDGNALQELSLIHI